MGRIKKRADGRYCVQIYLGRDEAGKKRYKSVYGKSPTEVKEKEAAVRLQLGRGLDVLSQRDSFSTWADDFLRLKNAAQITDRQKENYRHTVDVWKSEFQGYEVGQVRADDVERVLVGLQKAGFAARTVSFYRSTIRQILQRAVGRVIASNPVGLVSIDRAGPESQTAPGSYC